MLLGWCSCPQCQARARLQCASKCRAGRSPVPTQLRRKWTTQRRNHLVVPVPLVEVAMLLLVPCPPDETTAHRRAVWDPLLAHFALTPSCDTKLLRPCVELPAQRNNVAGNVRSKHIISTTLPQGGPLDRWWMAKSPPLGGRHARMQRGKHAVHLFNVSLLLEPDHDPVGSEEQICRRGHLEDLFKCSSASWTRRRPASGALGALCRCQPG